MKKRIVLSLTLIFFLFLTGTGVLLYYLFSSSTSLRYLISLHEIEDIRQELGYNLQNTQFYIYAPPKVFAEHLDDVIESINLLDESISSCNDCHHEDEIRQEIQSAEKLVTVLKEELSYLITMVTEGQRRQQLQANVSELNNEIKAKVHGMVLRAAATIQRKSDAVMYQIDKTYVYLCFTLLLTLLLAFFVAQFLMKSITMPINALVKATEEIGAGNWGYQISYLAKDEFAALIDIFNTMSRSLHKKKEQLQLQMDELKSAQDQLVQAERLTALGTMAGGIANDFNNILGAMMGHLSLLKKSIPQDDENLTILSIVEEAGFRASELNNQLLAFARKKTSKPKSVNITECISNVFNLLSSTLSNSISIRFNLVEPAPYLLGDQTQIEQVIMNLCFNACDAMPDGGELKISTINRFLDEQFLEKYKHTDIKSGEYVQLIISDTGAGIDKKVMSHIFEPFFTTKGEGKGTGLGLAIVYGIVKAHGGCCFVDSVVGSGTTFTIYLPMLQIPQRKMVISV
jgi:signal transduction histidine kinase